MQKTTFTHNGITIVEMPVDLFKVVWLDREKRTGAQVTQNGNFCNANFFAYYDEAGYSFRLPVGHLKCDIYSGFELHEVEEHYMHERGKIEGSKFTWEYDNPCYGKAVSTLCVRNHKAFVNDIIVLDTYQDCDYIISGVPVLRHGEDVSCYNYVIPQGWGLDTLRSAYHVFVGIKAALADTIYVMYYQSTSNNLIYGMEFYNKIKDLGFQDIIKLDGGGSFIFKCPDLNLSKMTSTVRIIDAVLTFDELPIPEDPTKIDKAEVLKSVQSMQTQILSMVNNLDKLNAELQNLTIKLQS